MKDDIRQLLALQEVELDIFKAEHGLEDIPAQLAELDSIMAAREAALNAIDHDLAELDDRKAPLEEELKENQIILTAADDRIKKIKTNKEFLALQREIDVARKRKNTLEDQILTLMEKRDRQLKERETILKGFEADKAVLDEKKAALTSQSAELASVIAGDRSRIDALRATVERGLLSRYDRIKSNRKGIAVVACLDGICHGCHMRIPPQVFNELVRGDKLINCPTCQRILYVEEP